MGRRVERRARRGVLQLTHPAEGIALSVAGALVIATLWSSYQNFEDPAVVTVSPTASSQPTSMESMGRQDAASYPSALLQPKPVPSTVGQGVRAPEPPPEQSVTASDPSTATDQPTTASPEPSPEPSSATKPPATTEAPTTVPPTKPADPPPTTVPPTTVPPTTVPPTKPAAPPTTPAPPGPPGITEPPGDGSPPSSEPTVTGAPSAPGGTATTGSSTSKPATTQPQGASGQD